MQQKLIMVLGFSNNMSFDISNIASWCRSYQNFAAVVDRKEIGMAKFP